MDPRHAILFEPVAIGPKTLPNRFYQVPHASGFGSQQPRAQAAFRAVKAEGGWGGVCVEYAPVSRDSDETPAVAADFSTTTPPPRCASRWMPSTPAARSRWELIIAGPDEGGYAAVVDRMIQELGLADSVPGPARRPQGQAVGITAPAGLLAIQLTEPAPVVTERSPVE